ncbi:MAG: endolytic transglycosylase MltG [Rhodobacteraceae bacterium]|nr:endolytic transglycosylase MltG [Paracoccaceae bacterium]
MSKLGVLLYSLLAFVALSFCMAAIAVWFVNQSFHSQGPIQEPVFFDVGKGESLASVASSLKEEGIIRSEIVFQLGAMWTRKATLLKYGTYELEAGASMAEVLGELTTSQRSVIRSVVVYRVSSTGSRYELWSNQPGGGRELVAERTADTPWPDEVEAILATGKGVSYQVTVAEGLTSIQVAEALSAADFLAGDVNEIPAEGTLAPQSYSVFSGTGAADLLMEMEASQSAILQDEWNGRPEGAFVETVEAALILASIIEKETSVPDERGLIASVFTNRLRRGMKLQADPTVIYGLSEGRGTLGRTLTRRDLEVATPYNTYLHTGLPPTPISNPGRESIRKALNPDESDYLYFVADGSGGHAFAKTYEEHRENVRHWRRVNQ